MSTSTGDLPGSPFAYPFSSSNAWIRGQPENATTMLSIIGAESKDVVPVAYFDPGKSALASEYRSLSSVVRQDPGKVVPNKAVAYRTLSPGELDIASQYAQLFFGMRDVAQMRGGLSHLALQSMFTRMETPLLRVEGPAHVLSGNLVDELRFGTVRRDPPDLGSPSSPVLVRGDGGRRLTAPGSQLSPVFAKEFTVLVDWMGEPGKLIDHRQGIVTDDDGTFPDGGPKRKPMRARYRWFSNGVPGELNFTTTEIDEKGNIFLQTSSDASDGVAMDIPDGDFGMQVGGNRGGKFNIVCYDDAQIVTKDGGRFAIVADGGWRINAPEKGELVAKRGIGIASEGIINIDSETASGITLGKRSGTKYPVLVAHPDYLQTVNNYYSSQASLSSALGTFASQASAAWSATGPLLMLLDPSGVVMGTCLSAASGALQVSAAAPQVATAIGQHLPKLAKMPSGFVSAKTVSQ